MPQPTPPSDAATGFDALVAASADVAATRSRSAKTARLAELLRAADPADIGLVAGYASGRLRQRRTGVGWAALRQLSAPAGQASLTVREVDATFDRASRLAGPGSATARTDLMRELFGRATAAEQQHLLRLVGGELRQGALESIVVDALAKAFDQPVTAVRRAVMLGGELPAVATALATDGADGLHRFRLQVGRPVQPMLAAAAPDVGTALAKVGASAEHPARLDHKLDGVRVQVHRDGDRVVVASRSLDDLTDRLPEVVDTALALPVREAVLDGEVLALDETGRPAPFQVTAARTATRDADTAGSQPLRVYFFDLLRVDGADLLDVAAADRWRELERVVPAGQRVPYLYTADPAAAQAFFDDAIDAGQEGLVVKSSTAAYAAGRRGAGWVKVKPRHTLDLVVLAAEWGHGRRRGLLSNLHLGARDPHGEFGPAGEYVMVGKTFKGLTDELLAWQTAEFVRHERDRDDYTVWLHPAMVVEIAFDGVQTSRRYPGGAALRFARVLRYRPDKPADQADTVGTILRLQEGDQAADDEPVER